MRKAVKLTTVLALLVVLTVAWSWTAISLTRKTDSNVPLQELPLANGSNIQSRAALYANRTMIFVHIGKTGGETIKWRLQVICDLRGSKRKKARCKDQFSLGESLLSRRVIGYTHCGSRRPRKSMELATSFLFSIRDPIDRLVSWFQYMHPLNCWPERPSGACNLKRDTTTTWGVDFFQTCFPTMDRLLDVLQQQHSSSSSMLLSSLTGSTDKEAADCATMVIRALEGNGPRVQSNHLYFNYFYNYNRTILEYPERDVWVVRQESLWPDLKQIETLLGGDGSRKFEHEGPIITHASEKFLYKVQAAKLNAAHLPAVCCVMRDEILVYAYLLHHAVNLEPTQKQTSMKNLLVKCGTDSLHTLSNTCGWRKPKGNNDGNVVRRLEELWPMLDVKF
ncbi:unnamed protein product [Cylindrotheca closterium]|uniref:Sulfotransferase n=1 Tax=Cylindrotheca closterium TaxID=2856 RepID=A0AAD2CCA5_9STRA|nr:unnamed protein product [Cylindrotheca closterium]